MIRLGLCHLGKDTTEGCSCPCTVSQGPRCASVLTLAMLSLITKGRWCLLGFFTRKLLLLLFFSFIISQYLGGDILRLPEYHVAPLILLTNSGVHWRVYHKDYILLIGMLL